MPTSAPLRQNRVWPPIVQFEQRNIMRRFWRLKRRNTASDRRVPLPPQQLLVTAAALSMAAVVVSVMIATGDLP